MFRTYFRGKSRRIFVLALLTGAAIMLFALDQQQYRLLEAVQASYGRIIAWYGTHPWLVAILFTAAYALLNGLFLPGGLMFVLLAGALFAPLTGIGLVTLGYIVGVGAAFLIARYSLKHKVQSAFPEKLQTVNESVVRHGWMYVVILRLVPLLPAPLVTLLMALTPLLFVTFVIASLVGRLPLTSVYVLTGSELSAITSPGDVLTPQLLGLLLAVALLVGLGHWLQYRLSLRVHARHQSIKH